MPCKLQYNPKINKDSDEILNWVWAQMMNHMYYWVTLDDYYNIEHEDYLLSTTISALKNWKQHFECGYDNLSKNPPPDNLSLKMFTEETNNKKKRKPNNDNNNNKNKNKKIKSDDDIEEEKILLNGKMKMNKINSYYK